MATAAGISGVYCRNITMSVSAALWESLGVPVMEREDGKIFPASMNGRDVLKALLHRIRQNGTDIISGAKNGYPPHSRRRIPGGRR